MKYSFLADVFTKSAVFTLNNYDTLDGNAADGILYDTLRDMQVDFKDYLKKSKIVSKEYIMWARENVRPHVYIDYLLQIPTSTFPSTFKGVLKFEEMKIKEKIVYNPHTNEIIGFEEGGLDEDVLQI